MLNKVFKFFDRLPIVRILQCAGAFVFVSGLLTIAFMFSTRMSLENLKHLSNLFPYVLIQFSTFVFSASVLFGLAEIIKLMKVKVGNE